MPSQPTVKELIARLVRAGRRCTLLGVGPVSEIVVRATFEACRRHKCPAMFIASRNQVDLNELGGGYLMGGMDQRAFVELLRRWAGKTRYRGPVYICRDHGGPWQRNAELDGRYEVGRAMDIGKQSFRADIEAGFNYIHIDPTKCPLPYTPQQLCDWTVELLAYCEQVRRELGKPELDYEVGTEDIQGGLTTAQAFEDFLRALTGRLKEKGLPLPTCVVGQTGTLTRTDHNIGRFDRVGTSELAAIAAKYGVGFKEHNGDYLSAAACRIHPELGVTGMNVAPEYGLVETDALLALADLEAKLVREGFLRADESSGLRELIYDRTFAASPWRKWMTDDVKKLPAEGVSGNASLRLLIARVCGHYVYDLPEVKAARAKLYENINRFELADDAEGFVVGRVRESVEFCIRHFALDGVNELAGKER